MAAAEWRLFGWMERQGIDYDLYGETQFHFDQVPLDQYKVLVISTHPELLVPRDVLPAQALGLRARRAIAVLGRQRTQL